MARRRRGKAPHQDWYDWILAGVLLTMMALFLFAAVYLILTAQAKSGRPMTKPDRCQQEAEGCTNPATLPGRRDHMHDKIKQLEQELLSLELDRTEAEFDCRNQGFSNRNNRKNQRAWDRWKELNMQIETKEEELREARSSARDKSRRTSTDMKLLMEMMEFLWRQTMQEQNRMSREST